MSEATLPVRVLVLEDDPGIAVGLRHLLESRGFVVELADSAETALERVRRGRYAIVVADFDLGDQDGATIVRRIRLVQPDLPVLAVTAHDRQPEGFAAEELSLQGFLQKPVDPERLLDAVLQFARA